VGDSLVPAADALASVNLKPEPLSMKEGLSIVNGTSFMTAAAGLTLHRLCKLLPLSLAACASCVEAMLGMDSPYMPFVHEGKRHAGQIKVAAFVSQCFEGSQMIRKLSDLRLQWREMLLSSGRADQENVQDCYSLRGIAHGFGPFADDLQRSVQWVENEMNSLNDNPVIDAETDYIFSSANFLGDYIAVACDHLRADVAKAGTWMHAIFGNLVTARKSRGLPSCLVTDPEVGTGFKIVQLLVGSLVMQNRTLCLPVSAVMLPTEGDNQDMVSLGTHSVFNLIDVTNNFQTIIATTMLAAAQALELRGIEKAGAVSRKLWEFVREKSAFLEADRPLHDEIAAVSQGLHTCNIAEPWFI
jgi:histidine ammonia-lyase